MSASDNLSTKCSGLLLRSSFAILAASTRHLISAARMPAFSVASRLSNSSDILLFRHLQSRSHRRRSPVVRTRFKTLIYLKGFGAGACGGHGFNEQILAQMNKSPKLAAALVQKMYSRRENSVRAMLVVACSVGGDDDRKPPELPL